MPNAPASDRENAEPTALVRACEVLGGATALAEAIGETVQVVSNWKKRGVPAEKCRAVETATAGRITRYDLRPDVFGERPERAKAA